MRKILLFLIVITTSVVFILRLFYLQVYASEPYSIYEDNAIRKVLTYPKRGYIYDRNNNLLVSNQPSYDVMIIPGLVKELDTLEFCDLLKISKTYFDNKIERTSRYSRRIPSVFLAHLSKEDYGFLAEKIRKFDGFYIQKRNLRQYNTKIGANVLGYVAEVNRSNLEKDNYYSQGDIIGKQGVELSYEKYLRGEKGIKFIQKDRFNRDIGSYNNGLNDKNSIAGKDLIITIDSELQEYGELLMSNKKGAIVAIEPSTGELLSLVSAPSYNPNLLVGRERSKNYFELYKDSIYKPLIDKGLLSTFPAGSPFKVIVGLIALQENVINDKNTILCGGEYIYGRNKKSMKCHCGGGYRNIYNAISESCNSYFADAYRKTISKDNNISKNFDMWSEGVKSFGLGNYLNNDLPIGKKGMIPTSEFYDRWYPDFRWGPTTNLSNSIGQGEILTTPIQMANFTSAIANRGFFIQPHFVKKINNQPINNKDKKLTTINKENFEIVIDGMVDVVDRGTARIAKIRGINVAGKTGTVENFILIENEKKQLTDHSTFIAFAPAENPKIAVSVFIENGYWGSRWAAPIASLIIEKYLNENVERKWLESRMLNGSLVDEYEKPYKYKNFSINE